jgi:hypothetical protein
MNKVSSGGTYYAKSMEMGKIRQLQIRSCEGNEKVSSLSSSRTFEVRAAGIGEVVNEWAAPPLGDSFLFNRLPLR